MQPIKKGIQNFFNTNSQRDPLLFIEIIKAWKSVVEKKIFKHTEILSFKDKTLFIKTHNPIFRNEITLKKMSIVKKINKKLKNKTIKKLNIL